MHQTYAAAADKLHQHLDHDPKQVEEATRALCASWFSARELLVEASMASRYFHCMLEDLEQSQRNMDLMSMNVPKYAAPVPSYVSSSEQARQQAAIRRTYHSSESC